MIFGGEITRPPALWWVTADPPQMGRYRLAVPDADAIRQSTKVLLRASGHRADLSHRSWRRVLNRSGVAACQRTVRCIGTATATPIPCRPPAGTGAHAGRQSPGRPSGRRRDGVAHHAALCRRPQAHDDPTSAGWINLAFEGVASADVKGLRPRRRRQIMLRRSSSVIIQQGTEISGASLMSDVCGAAACVSGAQA